MTIKQFFLIGVMLSALFNTQVVAENKALSSSEILVQSSQQEWRKLDLDNTLILALSTGQVVIELNPDLAPNHVANFKMLVREKFYQNLNIYRFVEGFVAQGGDVSKQKLPGKAKRVLKAEFYRQTAQALPITVLDKKDGYADKTGFYKGFAVAQNQSGTKTWQVHCPGNFAMARDNDKNSGGTEFYIALGEHRYLDLNISSFGRVISGIEHIQRLDRKPNTNSADTLYNPIISFAVASDLSSSPAHTIQVLKTNSDGFKQYLKARRNRTEAWFHYQANYLDVCSVSVPVRISEE